MSFGRVHTVVSVLVMDLFIWETTEVILMIVHVVISHTQQ